VGLGTRSSIRFPGRQEHLGDANGIACRAGPVAVRASALATTPFLPGHNRDRRPLAGTRAARYLPGMTGISTSTNPSHRAALPRAQCPPAIPLTSASSRDTGPSRRLMKSYDGGLPRRGCQGRAPRADRRIGAADNHGFDVDCVAHIGQFWPLAPATCTRRDELPVQTAHDGFRSGKGQRCSIEVYESITVLRQQGQSCQPLVRCRIPAHSCEQFRRQQWSPLGPGAQIVD